MKWEELTGDRFAAAVEECQGVCLVALSVIERHGHHLPLGTDMYIGRETLRRAAALESAIEFPDYIFTQILEARHRVGTIAIDGDLMLKLLDNVCREIARNGLKKIVLVCAHGGNTGLMSFFNKLQLESPRDYTVYTVEPFEPAFDPARTTVPWKPEVDGHAGPGETSMILATHPDLVHAEAIVAGEGAAMGCLRELHEAEVQTGISWYSDYPNHYQGDASFADAWSGDHMLDVMAEAVARAVRAIKADTESRRLLDAFYGASGGPTS
jgi:creatinine amidohydrolase